VFSLLGARVTVLDLAEGQLEGDRRAAAHYGYSVRTVQGDMRDLSAFAEGSFHIVYGTGMAYVPDAREVYREVARALAPGGLYRVDFTNPAVEFMDASDWDGAGYRITRPYGQKQRRREDGAVEFRHSVGDIFNGLLVREVRRRAEALGMNELEVGTSPDNANAVSFYKRQGLADESLTLGTELGKQHDHHRDDLRGRSSPGSGCPPDRRPP